MDPLKEFFKRDRYAQHSGIELLSVAPGHAVAQMRIESYHLNALGIVQGGAVFTLADLATLIPRAVLPECRQRTTHRLQQCQSKSWTSLNRSTPGKLAT